MKREGPGFFQKLFGQIAYPPAINRCSSCGQPGADTQAQKALTEAKMLEAARLAALCPACRMRLLKKSLSR